MKYKIWEELISYIPLIDHKPHTKDESINSSIIACICCRGNVHTNNWPSNDKGIYIQIQNDGIYEVRSRDEIRCHDIHNKFQKDSFRHSKVDTGGGSKTS
jgi:hypothetical protein